MSNISQKLTYLNETKSQLKDMINYGLPTENQITNETTFRNYVKGIFEAFIESLRDSTTLYTNLPKISGNGTQITLNDTANAPMRITLNPSALSQDATPTPSSPQDIHTISGDNSVVVEGKNLFSNANLINATIQNNGNLTNGSDRLASDYISLKNETNLTLSFKQSVLFCGIAYYDSNKTFISRTYENDISIHISTIPSNAKYCRAFVQVANGVSLDSSSLATYEVMLNEGNTALPYEPYVSQTSPINLGNIEYCKIGNYEDKFILTSGKNIFNDTYNHLGMWSSTVGNTTTFSESATYLGAYCKVEAGKTYSISMQKVTNRFRVAVGTEIPTENTIGLVVAKAETLTKVENITIPTGYSYLYLYLSNTSETSDNLNLMINEGTTALPYEPYGTNQWYLKKNIGKVVLDGSESGWNVIAFSNTNDFKEAYTTAFDNDILWNTRNGFADRFSNFNDVIIPTSNITSECFSLGGDNSLAIGRIRFAISSNTISTTAQWKTWLSNNNTTVYYVMATPTYTQITGTLETQLENIYKNMLSYKGTTNISQVNNDLPFVLGVSAIQDLE